MRKFFTADFHLGSEKVLYAYSRPFKDVDIMNNALIDNCNAVATEDDIIYHIGDLYCFRRDGEFSGLDVPWKETRKRFNSMFLPLSGNHDENNGVRTVASSLRLILGGKFHCVLCHYPSYDPRAKHHLMPGDINICGHVHTFWESNQKFFIDKERKILNINVGVDVWNYRPVSEVMLTNYIISVMAKLSKQSNFQLPNRSQSGV